MIPKGVAPAWAGRAPKSFPEYNPQRSPLAASQDIQFPRCGVKGVADATEAPNANPDQL